MQQGVLAAAGSMRRPALRPRQCNGIHSLSHIHTILNEVPCRPALQPETSSRAVPLFSVCSAVTEEQACNPQLDDIDFDDIWVHTSEITCTEEVGPPAGAGLPAPAHPPARCGCPRPWPGPPQRNSWRCLHAPPVLLLQPNHTCQCISESNIGEVQRLLQIAQPPLSSPKKVAASAHRLKTQGHKVQAACTLGGGLLRLEVPGHVR